MNDLFEQVNNYERHEKVDSILCYSDNSRDNEKPWISIIMPIYNNPEMFKLALESARKQNADFNYEIVIVDNRPYDGLLDDEEKYVRKINDSRIKYYRNKENIGMYGNWNRGIELSRGQYVTFCHNDDLLKDNCLSRLKELSLKYGKKVVISVWDTIDEEGNYIEKLEPNQRKSVFKQKPDFEYKKFDIFMNGAGFGVGCLFDRECLITLGGFNPDYYPSADYALFAKYIFEYGGAFNRIPTFCYRKAVNESYKTYMDFIERDKFFRQCMLEKMMLPKKIGNRIINANYNYGRERFSVKWGGKDHFQKQNVPRTDRVIVTLCNKLNAIRRYSLW